MKKQIILLSLLASTVVVQAQTIDDAHQKLYYEQYQGAENTLHTVLQQQPNQPEAWYDITKAYLSQDEVQQAADSLQKAPEAVKSEPYFSVAQGAVLLEQGKKDSAAQYFNNALSATREKDAGILAAVAHAQIEAPAGDANYAIELLQKAMKREKHNSNLQVLLGDAYRKLGNGSAAYQAYQKAIDEDKNNAAAYHKMGEIFLSQKNTPLYLEYFNKALAADSSYAPSLYKLYVHYFMYDPAKAMAYYQRYAKNADNNVQQDYDLTDLYFVNKNYDLAIEKAKELLQSQGEKTKPRIYKLIAYSYAEKKDSADAMQYIQQYLAKEADSNIIAKDYELMADLFTATEGHEDSAMVYYTKAANIEKDSTSLYGYYKKLADLAKDQKDYEQQATWLGKYVEGNEKANNVDLFNWGIAYYRAQDFVNADSVFGKYIAKYPEQGFGYYWQARSVAGQDSGMMQGLAIPYYEKLISVLQADTTNNESNKSWLVEAYTYLGAYAANKQKDYPAAIGYFQKILEVDPDNSMAQKNIDILQKSVAKSDSSK